MCKLCGPCSRYIADWFDQKIRSAFAPRHATRLAKSFQPTATQEITRLLMQYIAEEDHYEKTLGKIQNFITFGGFTATLYMFSTSIPAVVDTLEAIEMAFVDASAKGYEDRREWIHGMVFHLFLDLLDVHRNHLGKTPFTDVWMQRHREKAAAAAAQAGRVSDTAAVCGSLDDDFEDEIPIIVTPKEAGVTFLDSYLDADKKEEWDALYNS